MKVILKNLDSFDMNPIAASFLVFSVILVLAYLVLFFVSPKGKWGKGNKNVFDEKDFLDKKRRSLQDSELTEIRSLISRFSEKDSVKEEFEYFVKKVSKAIDYCISRHDWFEEQRGKVFSQFVAIFSSALAIVAVMSRIEAFDSCVEKTILGGLLTVMIFSLFRISMVYHSELNADRDYRYISDIRFWFFRYNLPEKSKSNSDPKEAVEDVSGQRFNFFERVLDNYNIENSIREDLEQLFILHVLQRHKQESLTKMQWALSSFIIFGALQLVLLIVLKVI